VSLTDPTLPASTVSDPKSPDYDPRSPLYDATADPSSKYYVGPIKPDDVLSGDQIRAAATEQVDQEIKDGWLGPVVDPKVRDQKIQEQYEQRLDEARHNLGDGLEIRQTDGAPHTVWSNASHEQMQQAISQNADSATVAASSEEWVSVGNDLAGHQQSLAQAINASTSEWSGGGGDAAREHLANVGKWLGVTAQGSTLSGRQQEIHSQTLNETQKAMAANPPVQFSVQDSNARLQQIKDPVVYAEQAGQAMSAYREQQAAREQAAQTMSRFDDTIGSAVVTPQFPAPPKLAGSSGGGAGSPGSPVSPRSQNGPAGGPNGGPGGTGSENNPAFTTQSGPGGSGPGGTNSGGPGNPSSDLPPGGGPGGGPGGSNPGGNGNPPLNLPPGGGPGGTSGDGTHVQGYTPPPVTLPPGGGPGSVPGGGIPAIPGGGNPGGTGPGYTPPAFTPPGINPGTNLGPGGGSGPGATGGKIPTIGRGGGVNGESIGSRLGGGGGGGSGSLGGGGTGGSGGSGGKGSGLGGPGSASGSGSAAGEETTGRGAGAGAGGKGATGSPGMGGMGAGAKGGKGPEDKEHKIADFVESDDPSFFSPDEVVAPPVIGDWKNTDWK
jgi:hypothetical protein